MTFTLKYINNQNNIIFIYYYYLAKSIIFALIHNCSRNCDINFLLIIINHVSLIEIKICRNFMYLDNKQWKSNNALNIILKYSQLLDWFIGYFYSLWVNEITIARLESYNDPRPSTNHSTGLENGLAFLIGLICLVRMYARTDTITKNNEPLFQLVLWFVLERGSIPSFLC